MRTEQIKFFAFLILLATGCEASTYYIDFNGGDDASSGIAKGSPWKRCPAMPGFKGAYAHKVGDIFIFKGGTVWPAEALPLAITLSGAAGYPDSYTTDHSWYSGLLWSQPTMDGKLGSRTILSCSSAEFFAINDLRFIDAGSLTANGVKGTDISDCGDFEITHNTFAMQSWGGLYIWTSKPKTFNNILIHHNDISRTAFGIRVVPSGAASIIRNVQIYNNSLHDFHSQLSGDVHGDGIQHYCSPDNAASFDRYIDGFKIYNNTFTGDFTQVAGSWGAMTALVYLSGASKGVEVYNNLFAPQITGKQTPNFFESFISLRDNPSRGGFHKIYNNTFVTQVPDGQGAALLEDDLRCPSPNLQVKNNIFYGFQWPFDLRSLTHTFNNNDLQFTRSVGKWNGKWVDTFSAWQSLGNDINGISADPKFVSPTDYHLLLNSPCLNRGALLPTAYAWDGAGIARPQGTSFDIGAFERVEAVAANPTGISPQAQLGDAATPSTQGKTFGINGRRVQTDPKAKVTPGAWIHFK